jgi:4-diphosphocytidyl-2-C-methyl-D-erythritol kinase
MRRPPAAGARVRVRACAKINLTLRVLGKRPDGYHELRTTFQSVALHDTLTFASTSGPFAIAANEPSCPCDESNLVWKAAERLWAVSGRRGALSGVTVHIHKRVPSEAGLGGGSSNAAAALRALRELWDMRVPDDVLFGLGATIGADVPFFLGGGTMLGLDRGDLLFRLAEEPRAWVVIARPDFGVGTRDAYAWWDEERSTVKPPRRATAARTGAEHVNDLQRPVTRKYPAIGRLIRMLDRAGARHAAMSGSGSAVFGLFDERSSAEQAATALDRPPVRVWLTRTTTGRQHERLSAVERLGG